VDSFTCATGVRMPRILYGTAWKKTETGRLVATAIRQGFRGLDTACQPKHYDEAGVGAGIATALAAGSVTRDDLYLQTKFTSLSGQDPQRIPYDPTAPIPQQVAQSCEVSLRNLRTEWLDCLVLHSPLPTLRQTHEAWQAMETLVDAGKTKQLGISNCYELRELESIYGEARIKPAVLQNRFHADTSYGNDIRAYCRQQDNFLTDGKLVGTYTVPKIDVAISGLFYSRPGPQLSASRVFLNSEVASSLGRNLSANAQTVTINLVTPGTLYGERRNQLDLRLTKNFTVQRLRAGVNFELYNLFNANTVLTENATYRGTTETGWRIPTSIMPPRFIKVSVQLDF